MGYNKGNNSNYLGTEGCCEILQREQFQLSGHRELLWDITKGTIPTIGAQRAVVGYNKGNYSHYLGTESCFRNNKGNNSNYLGTVGCCGI